VVEGCEHVDPTRVLVVDDNALYGSTLSRFVASRMDMEVVGLASDGREAVLKADALRPDVVVMDLHMPGVDGFEATRHLKASLTPPRVIVLTAHHTPENRLLAQAAGADAFLSKHEIDRGLIDVIEHLMDAEDVRPHHEADGSHALD
jgi:DNA-binding NarL/FixJ family response regulator